LASAALTTVCATPVGDTRFRAPPYSVTYTSPFPATSSNSGSDRAAIVDVEAVRAGAPLATENVSHALSLLTVHGVDEEAAVTATLVEPPAASTPQELDGRVTLLPAALIRAPVTASRTAANPA
jgi:hypothetical protein